MPECSDTIRIHVVLRSVSAHPSNRALNVIELRRPAIVRALKKSIVHRKGYKTVARKKISYSAHGALVECCPPASMNQQRGRTSFGSPVGSRFVDIKVQLGAVHCRIKNIFFDRDSCTVSL